MGFQQFVGGAPNVRAQQSGRQVHVAGDDRVDDGAMLGGDIAIPVVKRS